MLIFGLVADHPELFRQLINAADLNLRVVEQFGQLGMALDDFGFGKPVSV